MKEELTSTDITSEVDVPENQGTEKKKKKILKKIVAPNSAIIGELYIQKGQIIFIEQEEKELPLIEITDKIRRKILDYLKNNEIKDDEADVHKFAEEMKMNTHQLELEIYKIVQTFLRGGVSFDNKVTKDMVDEKEFAMGVKIEQEHVNSSSPYAKFIAEKIDLDHLGELPNSKYYSYLDAMEKQMEKDIEG